MRGIPTVLAVRTTDWKYIVYPDAKGPNEELYHLAEDPGEMTNLALRPEAKAKLKEMRALFEKAKREVGYVRPQWPGG